MLMRMAAHKGRTVEQLSREMSSAELSDWLAYDGVYGYPDIYFMTGEVCKAIAGAMGGRRASAADYVPFFRPPSSRQQREQSPDEQRAIVRAHLDAARARRGVKGSNHG